eukprot:scaffold19_cov114-Cylindrotheca_fusiformis.AAC.10
MEKPQDGSEQEHGKAKNEANRRASTSVNRISALRNHRMRFQDAIDPNAIVVTAVGSNDILLGRGRGFQDHDGNKRMRTIVDKYKEQYYSVKRSKKRGLVEEVYREIIEGGARFLIKPTASSTPGRGFVVVDEEVAIQKVNNALRCKKGFHKVVASETQGAGSEVSTRSAIDDAMNNGSIGLPLVARIDGGGAFPRSLSAMQPLNPLAASVAVSLQQNNFDRYGFWRGLSSPSPMADIYPQEDLGYCNTMMRQNQLLHQTLLLQHLQDELITNAARLIANVPIPSGRSGSSNFPTNEDEQASPKVEYSRRDT